MTEQHNSTTSLWIESTPETSFAPLSGRPTVDVAVVGGGVAGVTAALLLKRAGKTVALLDSVRPAAEQERVSGLHLSSIACPTSSRCSPRPGRSGTIPAPR